MQPITIIKFAVRVGALRINTDLCPLHVYIGDGWVVIYVKYTVVVETRDR